MTLCKLKECVDFALDTGGRPDDPVLITTRSLIPTVGARPSSGIKWAGMGMDWEGHEFRLEPEKKLYEQVSEAAKEPLRMRCIRYIYRGKTQPKYHCPVCEAQLLSYHRFCHQCGQSVYLDKSIVDREMWV